MLDFSVGFVVYFLFWVFSIFAIFLFNDHGLSTDPVLGLVFGAAETDKELTN